MRRMYRIHYLFLAAMMPATLFAQRVTLSVNKTPLEKVCKEVERQTGYYFVYSKDLRDTDQKITVDLKNAEVNTALQQIFERTPFRYEVTNKVVSVNTTPKPAHTEKIAATKDTLTITVKGRLYTNLDVTPLENASVSSSFSKRTTLTNEKGEFELKGVYLGEEIIVSYVGYQKHHEVIMGPIMTIFLKTSNNVLDQVVVKAYGTTSKRFNTSNIVTVSGKDLQDLPVQNPLLALEGRVPGLQITRANSSPTSPIKIEIRGRNSINKYISSEPLYIIDGVPQTVMDLQQNFKSDGSTPNANIISYGLDQSMGMGQSPIFGLSPNDIESIEVLKDAGATAIYGSRGANGVILITTKKVKPGNSKFSLSMSQGVKNAVRYQPFLHTSDFVAMRKEAYANAGLTPSKVPGTPGYAPEIMVADTNRYTDWQKYMYGGTGLYTSVNPQLSGGTQNSSYLVSASYTKQTDITPANASTQSASVLLKLDNHSNNNKLKTGISVFYLNSTNKGLGSLNQLTSLPPNAPDAFDSLGNLNFAAYRRAGIEFPFAALKETNTSQTSRINAGFNIGYTLAKGLEISTQIGYNMSNNKGGNIIPVASKDPHAANGSLPTGLNAMGTTDVNNLSVEPQLNWNKSLGHGILNVLVGGTYQSNTTRSTNIRGLNYLSDDMINAIGAAPSLIAKNQSGQYKYIGAFSGINYTLSDKYMFNLSGRRDGSSRFGAGKQFGNFWAVGAGWIISEEAWAKSLLPKAVSFLKLRSSYGLTGSDGVGDYQYLSQWAYVIANNSGTQIISDYNGVVPIMETLAANDEFHWQTNKQLEVGLEFSFFDKLNFTTDWYQNRCNNQLLGYPLPFFTGFNSITANSVANVQNSGWDFAANTMVLQTTNVSWNINLNFNIQRNKLLSYPGLELSPYATIYRIGASLNNQALFHYLGVDPKTGLGNYLDLNHDGQINNNPSIAPGTGNDDRGVFMDLNPVFSGGFSTAFRYKNWSINPSFSFKRGYQSIGYNETGNNKINISAWQYHHRWTPTNNEALLPPLSALSTPELYRFLGSDRNYTMTNVLRLNSLRLSWAMPSVKAAKAHMSGLTFNLSADNLLLLTNYKASIDPDIPGNAPSLRTVTLGCNVSF
jgi:TonB-linked SusC/RagA family outer membrane protein